MRSDGSSFQVVDFDMNTSSVLGLGTLHGLNGSSCWSRGQAWGIYGFALASEMSDDATFIHAMRNLSDYYLRRAPDDKVPYWDFMAPVFPGTVRDTSAAAVACSGWVRFCARTTPAYARTMRKAGDASIPYPRITCSQSINDGILSEGCAYKNQGLGVNESTIWGIITICRH